MYLIKLDAIDSTNNYIKGLASVALPKDYTVVVANVQTKGKGQMGAKWQAESGKNLTVSMFKRWHTLSISEQFYISMATSLAVYKALDTFKIPQLRIKWPNDILSADKKICGILIENVIKDKLNSTIVGVGINVNQTKFGNLHQASSLKNITGVHYYLDEILKSIIENTKFYSKLLQDGGQEEVKDTYEMNLFRKNKPSTFKNAEGVYFSGFIVGVTRYGELKVLLEDEILKTFDLKEVTLMY